MRTEQTEHPEDMNGNKVSDMELHIMQYGSATKSRENG